MRIAALILGIIGAFVIWGISSFGAVLGAATSGSAAGSFILFISYAIPMTALVGAALALRFPLASGILLIGSGVVVLLGVGIGPVSFGITALVFIAGILALLGRSELPQAAPAAGGASPSVGMTMPRISFQLSRRDQFIALGTVAAVSIAIFGFLQTMQGKRLMRSMRGTPTVEYSLSAQRCFSKEAGALNDKAYKAMDQDLGMALGFANEAVSLEPDCGALLFTRGRILGDIGRHQDALVDFDYVLELEPDHSWARKLRGSIHGTSRNYDLAIDDLNRFISLYSARDKWIFYALNDRCYFTALRFPKNASKLHDALKDCDAALSIDQSGEAKDVLAVRNSAVWNSRCLVRLLLGRFDEALEDCNSSVGIDPKNADDYYVRGLAMIGKGDQAGGTSSIEYALSLNPKVSEEYDAAGVTKEYVRTIKEVPSASAAAVATETEAAPTMAAEPADTPEAVDNADATASDVEPTELTNAELDALASQIGKCWNVPSGASDKVALITKVKIYLKADGTEAATPELVETIPTTEPDVRAAQDAAIRAASLCAPYILPADKYQAWKEVVVTLNPNRISNY